MKYSIAICILAVASFSRAQTAESKGGIDPTRLAYIERLVMKPSDMVPWDSDLRRTTEIAHEKRRLMEMEEKRKAEIKSSPDFKPYLFFLLDHYYKYKSPDVAQVLSAIALRDDLTKEETDLIKKEIREILKRPHDSYDSLSNYYLIGAARVLGTQKSQENEELALAILNRARDPSYLGMIEMPAEALSRMGASRSIPSIESSIEWLQHMANTTHDEASRQSAFRVRRSLSALKEHAGGVVESSLGVVDEARPTRTAKSFDASQSPLKGPGSIYWLVGGMLIIPGIGLLLRLFKKK